ncbi:MAG: alpha-ketoglutarate-dependent dioxygenase AlkB [Rhodospirillaceae bacterium]
MQRDLFNEYTLPRGFLYRPEVLTPQEGQSLVAQFGHLPFKPFEFHGYLGHRRIVSYGLRYDYAKRRVEPAEPLPDFLFGLRDRAAAALDVPSERIAHGMVTEYTPGAGIGWHLDKPEFEEVIAFSLLAPCRLRFRRKMGDGWERRAAEIAPHSLYALRGESRWAWQHSIAPMDRLRYSVTFRTSR